MILALKVWYCCCWSGWVRWGRGTLQWSPLLAPTITRPIRRTWQPLQATGSSIKRRLTTVRAWRIAASVTLPYEEVRARRRRERKEPVGLCLHSESRISTYNTYSLTGHTRFSWNRFEIENDFLISAHLFTAHATQQLLNKRLFSVNNFSHVLPHKQSYLPVCFELADFISCCCLRVSLPVYPPQNVSVCFPLNRFHKESLLDLDASAACDCRNHLCVSLLVRHRCTEGVPSEKKWNHVRPPSINPHLVSLLTASDITQEHTYSICAHNNFEHAVQRCYYHHGYVRWDEMGEN